MSRSFYYFGCLILSSACGPGTGGSSDGSSSGSSGQTTSAGTSAEDTGVVPTSGASTSGASTSGPGTTSDLETGGSTSSSSGAVTTTDPTEDPSGTTGPLACEAIVGSHDCAALAEVSIDLSLETCMACQGAACGTDQICDGQFPCIDGEIVIQGCCSDEQCDGLTLFCGMFLGTNNVCVLHDDR